MTDQEFLAQADRTLARIEDAVDALDADIDAGRSGNVLDFTLPDGSKIIVNTQAPLHEIWVAARSGGFHYRWDGARWCDTRSGEELFAALSRLFGAPLHAEGS